MTGLPRTSKEQKELVAGRPAGWENLLLARVLADGWERLEPKWRDHQRGQRRVWGAALDDDQAMAFLVAAPGKAGWITSNAGEVLEAVADDKAFGVAGGPGDSTRIVDIGRRLVDVYEELLDWSAQIRSTQTSARMQRGFELAATLMDGPIAEIQGYVARVMSDPGSASGGRANNWSHSTTNLGALLTLRLSIDPSSLADLEAELTRRRAEESGRGLKQLP